MRQNGTYWYHSHTGLQEQLGHYGQLILEPAEPDPVDYDVEHSVVLPPTGPSKTRTGALEAQDHGGLLTTFQRPTLANLDDQMRATGMSLGKVIGKRLAWDRMRMDPTDIAGHHRLQPTTYLMNGQARADE